MKISVVIPIYNVAAYLPRCIESVIHQTYQDIEILLIDDGATDESGMIAEEYKVKDMRIKVIHKENGGLSDARNRGMQEATGEYLFFLDSDDWMDERTLDNLLDMMQKYDADIVMCGFYYTYAHGKWLDKRYWHEHERIRILNNKEAMSALLENEYIKNFAWGKLYKRELIQDILFEKGILFEDVFWQAQVFSKIQKCVVMKDPQCYYYQRDNSIVGKFNLKKLDMIKELYERHKFIGTFYPELVDKSWYSLLKACLEYYTILYVHRNENRSKKMRKDIRKFIMMHTAEFHSCTNQDKELQLRFKLFCRHPMFLIIYMAIRKFTRVLGIRKEEGVMMQVE